MTVLVVNAGSTSIKYKLFGEDGKEIVAGVIVYTARGFRSRLQEGGVEHVHDVDRESCESAATLVVDHLRGRCVERIGFRVVHGGERFVEPTRLTPEVLAALDGISDLAPLHNPPALEKMREFQALMPTTPQYAVFDTAFHATLPEEAFVYSIPYEFYQRHGIRKYGFHGISHKYVNGRLSELEPRSSRRIICHLGGGGSITAIRNGRSVETSMGFTPLEGLTMATRSGDLDPGVIFHLMDKLGLSLENIRKMLNGQSGLLGLSAQSSDMRRLLELEELGDQRAALAVSVYVYDIRRYIGAYAAVLGGADALAFTGGVGAGSAEVRRRACASLDFLGICLDDTLNDAARGGDCESAISTKGSTPVWVVPTNEELQIYREIFPLK